LGQPLACRSGRDYPAGVLALEAELRRESEAGARSVKAEDFFVELMMTAATAGEILTQSRCR
jgi:carbon-monoxide dehydrogenase medium subunit